MPIVTIATNPGTVTLTHTAGPVSGTALPTWAPASGTWTTATTNTMASVDPRLTNPPNTNGAGSTPPWGSAQLYNVLDVWNGGAFASGYGTKGALLLHGGGHASYNGSEVYAADLGARLIRRLNDPSAGPYLSGAVGTYPNGVYADGAPVPTHTYAYPAYDPVNNLLFIPKGVSSNTDSTATATTGTSHVFAVGSAAWRRGPTNSSYVSLYRAGGRTVWDSNRNVFWCMPCNSSLASRQIVKYANLQTANGDGTYGTLTNYPYTAVYQENESGACFDPASDLILWANFGVQSSTLYAIPLSSGVPGSRVALTMTGAPTGVSKASAIEWSARRQAIIVYCTTWAAGRAAVYEIRKPANPLTGTWVWALLTDASNTVVPAAPVVDNGVYSKFRIASYSDGELGLLVTRVDQPAFAFRIP